MTTTAGRPAPAVTETRLRALVAQGLSDPEIGVELGVSSRTVLRHRTRLGLESQWTPPHAAHGTARRYRNGCRCTKCRAANTHRMTTYRARRQLDTPVTDRYLEPWTPDEDAVLTAGEGSLAERAAKIGRTYQAAQNRLRTLRGGQQD